MRGRKVRVLSLGTAAEAMWPPLPFFGATCQVASRSEYCEPRITREISQGSTRTARSAIPAALRNPTRCTEIGDMISTIVGKLRAGSILVTGHAKLQGRGR